MISFDEALNIVMNQVRPLGYESVPLHEACGRILACDVSCDMDIPPFDKSAMDGYACRQADLPGPLRVIETIKAGIPPVSMVNRGECAKIMTGAMVPEGANCVIMVEHTEETGEGSIRLIKTTTGEHICYRGEDVRSGDVILHQGTRLGPQHIAVLATAGCASPIVARLPKVGIIATGDELVEPEVAPGPSQIRNSNGWQLYAQMKQTGTTVKYYGIMPDVENILSSALKKALNENDVVLISGGVSMGDFDLVPSAMINSGIQILFDSIAMKPGKPTTFGIGPSGCCFGLPGNPVSTFIQCEILVKPFLCALMGYKHSACFSFWPLAETFVRKKTDREAWIPVKLNDDNTVQPVDYHGSAHINALCESFAFTIVQQGVGRIEKGSLIKVFPL